MYDMNDYDERFQRHAQKAAAVDHDGWKKPQPRRRAVRAAVAKALFALAARLAPTIPPPSTIPQALPE